MTMKHTVFNITVILFLFSAAVQAQSPGGVAGPVNGQLARITEQYSFPVQAE